MLRLASILNTFLRIPFLLFVELVCIKRISFLYYYGQQYSDWISTNCIQCPILNEFYINCSIAIAFVICVFTSVMYVRGIFVVSFSIINLFMTYFVFVNYASLIYVITTPLSITHDLNILIHSHFLLGFVIFFSSCIFLIFHKLLSEINLTQLISIGTLIFIVPLVSYLPIWALSNPNVVHKLDLLPQEAGYDSASLRYNFMRFFLKPNCCFKELKSSIILHNYVCLPATQAWISPALVSTDTTNITYYSLAVNILPYILLNIYALLFYSCFKIAKIYTLLMNAIHFEFEFYHAVDHLDYIIAHWNRLDIPQILALSWSFKVILVIILGSSVWPIVPLGVETSSEFINSSILNVYTSMNDNQSILYTLMVRLYVGCFVHGSETWFSVFGAASFLGGLAMVIVSLLVYLIDPTGENTAQLAVVAADAPADPFAWNVIEDPALALDQNDVIAVELLASTKWNCAIVFLFLAFQADLPTLPPVCRISCSIYGIMVIAITCIHPVQALIKSLLLRLDTPGRGSNWLSHIRPLCFSFGLIVAALCIFMNIPEILTYGAYEYRKVSVDSTNSSLLTTVTFGSSKEVLKARQLKIFLSGCQLLLSLIVTLVEYGIYQFVHRNQQWTGFVSSLFWTKLISSVIDYLISLFSFLTVCWLLFYDSIGVCRLFIICCYFCFTLYPSALRAYKWLRWRLLFTKSVNNMVNPSTDDLVTMGDTCPICYTEMTLKTSKITRCGHLYHIQCLTQWMLRQLFCPICHADLLSSRVIDRRAPRQDMAPMEQSQIQEE